MLALTTYRDRAQAGRALAQRLGHHVGRPALLVLGLPRGGVVVAAEVARFLGAPLDVFVVRKLGLPGQEEFAIGAIASGGIHLVDEETVQHAGISSRDLEALTRREAAELARREKVYRAEKAPQPIAGRTVILVDDGVATGFSIRAAIAAVRRLAPERLVVAVPVGPPDTCQELANEVDEFICPLQPWPFHAVGVWYEHFAATSDSEVQACLAQMDAPR